MYSELPLIERARELSKLGQFASARTPSLLTGVSGLGKTRLLHELRAGLAAENIHSLYIPFIQPLHTFLISLALCLSIRTVHDSSVALRGLLWKALGDQPHVLLLDDITDATLPFYRFFEKVLYLPGVTVIGTAVDVGGIGALQRVFWNRQTIVSLRPLTRPGALLLTRQATHLFATDLSEDENFQRRVARVARGNPGRIVEMCTRAGKPNYRDNGRIRFAALSIDSLTRLVP